MQFSLPLQQYNMLPACVEHAARLFTLLNEQAARSTMPGNAVSLPLRQYNMLPACVEHAARLL